jgi:hypothetical protein
MEGATALPAVAPTDGAEKSLSGVGFSAGNLLRYGYSVRTVTPGIVRFAVRKGGPYASSITVEDRSEIEIHEIAWNQAALPWETEQVTIGGTKYSIINPLGTRYNAPKLTVEGAYWRDGRLLSANRDPRTNTWSWHRVSSNANEGEWNSDGWGSGESTHYQAFWKTRRVWLELNPAQVPPGGLSGWYVDQNRKLTFKVQIKQTEDPTAAYALLDTATESHPAALGTDVQILGKNRYRAVLVTLTADSGWGTDVSLV